MYTISRTLETVLKRKDGARGNTCDFHSSMTYHVKRAFFFKHRGGVNPAGRFLNRGHRLFDIRTMCSETTRFY